MEGWEGGVLKRPYFADVICDQPLVDGCESLLDCMGKESDESRKVALTNENSFLVVTFVCDVQLCSAMCWSMKVTVDLQKASLTEYCFPVSLFDTDCLLVSLFLCFLH